MDGAAVATHGRTLDQVRVDGLCLFEVTHQPALRISQHQHDLVKVCILLEGSFFERGGLALRSLKVSDVLVRASRQSHTNQYGGRGARSLLLEIPPDHRRIAAMIGGDGRPSASVIRAAHQLARAFLDPGADRTSSTRIAMRILLAAIVESGKRHAPPAWLEAIRERLAVSFARPLMLEELARYAGVHPVHLSHSFHAYFGQTLSAYLRALRVFHATELLQSEADIAAVAAECGFCDQSHLTHAFRREQSTAPGNYRRAMATASNRP